MLTSLEIMGRFKSACATCLIRTFPVLMQLLKTQGCHVDLYLPWLEKANERLSHGRDHEKVHKNEWSLITGNRFICKGGNSVKYTLPPFSTGSTLSGKNLLLWSSFLPSWHRPHFQMASVYKNAKVISSCKKLLKIFMYRAPQYKH